MKRALGLLLLVGACGKQGELMRRTPPGEPVPVVAPADLPSQRLIKPPQAEPARIDDPLTKSQERRDDRFSLPPPGGS